MSQQTSKEGIVKLFQSEAFINTHYQIVNVLLSGFGTTIDTTTLWKCVLKWSETKSNKDIVIMAEGDDDKDDEKRANDTEKIGDDQSSKHSKWLLIRKYFPFYLLPIDIVCTEVLSLKILSQEMAIELLSHKTNGYQRDLAKYCISHKPLFPSAEKSEYVPAKHPKHHVVFDSYRSTAAWNTTYPLRAYICIHL